MADLRVPPSSPPTVRGTGATAPAKSDAVRAAQRAFFDAALGQAAAPPQAAPAKAAARLAPTATAGVRPVPVAPTRVVEPAVTPGSPSQAGRLLRPGSLVDVKV